MAKMYRVTAPYITVKVQSSQGLHVRGYSAGALLPDGVQEESIQHHLRKKMIEEIEVSTPRPEPVLTQEQWEKVATGQPSTADPDQDSADPAAEQPPDNAEQPADTSGQGTDNAGQSPDDGGRLTRPPEAGAGSSKAAWLEYAVARGMGRDDAESLTRDQLIAAFPAEEG